jgi:SAM-dependent methyltransferase
VDVYYIEVEKGHDTFMVSKKITRTYYILEGGGYFTIDARKYEVSPGMLVEVPPGVEFSYSGNMKILAFSKPRWFAGGDAFTKWNPDVIQGCSCPPEDGRSWVRRLVRLEVFGKSPVNAYLRFSQRLWNKLPEAVTVLGPIRVYGESLHKLARIKGIRAQAFSTYFLRNRPQLELIQRLAERAVDHTLKVAVLGCSTGAEAYSVAWRIRSARPDLNLALHAVDISKQAVEVAKLGQYSVLDSQLTDTKISERMTPTEVEELFDREGDLLTIKPCIKKGITWGVGDVVDSKLVEEIGPYDIVIANNFLCHMNDAVAERSLRNIAGLVAPNGYLVVTGVNLDVRTAVAKDLGWVPLQELLEEIHNGDLCMRSCWPCHYGGLEPLNKRKHDWRLRYAGAFQVPSFREVTKNFGEATAVGNGTHCDAVEFEVAMPHSVADPGGRESASFSRGR